jgi:hypothetical protein
MVLLGVGASTESFADVQFLLWKKVIQTIFFPLLILFIP